MPNWCQNLMVMRKEDRIKLEPFITLEGEELRLDFNKVIPKPDTVWDGTGDVDRDSEEFKKKYPDGDWYNWNCDHWGTKWNSCHNDIPTLSPDQEEYTVWFDTAWSPPLPVIEELSRHMDFMYFYIEEGCHFAGAVPCTSDHSYPCYMDDPEGDDYGAIYEEIYGRSLYSEYIDEPERFFDTVNETLMVIFDYVRRTQQTNAPVHAHNLMVPGAILRTLDRYFELYKQCTAVIFDPVLKSDEVRSDALVKELLTTISQRDMLLDFEDAKQVPSIEQREDFVSIYSIGNQMKKMLRQVRQDMAHEDFGLTAERLNQQAINSLRRSSNRPKEIEQNGVLGIDSVIGRRAIFSRFIDSFSPLSVNSTMAVFMGTLARKDSRDDPVPSEQEATGTDITRFIDLTRALFELYDELPMMSANEFLRLVECYAKSSLMNFNELTVSRKTLLPFEAELKDLERQLYRIQFKNKVYTSIGYNNQFAANAIGWCW